MHILRMWPASPWCYRPSIYTLVLASQFYNSCFKVLYISDAFVVCVYEDLQDKVSYMKWKIDREAAKVFWEHRYPKGCWVCITVVRYYKYYIKQRFRELFTSLTEGKRHLKADMKRYIQRKTAAIFFLSNLYLDQTRVLDMPRVIGKYK